MMTFCIGFLGALCAAGLLGVGCALGWKVHSALTVRSRPRPRAVEERERRRLREQQQAFQTLQNYSQERAYGMLTEEEFHA